MPRNVVELERQAVLLAVAKLVDHKDTNVTALTNKIMALAKKSRAILPSVMGLTESEKDKFNLLVDAKQSKAMRSTLDRLAQGEGEEPRKEKQAILIFYARKDKTLSELTNEIYDALKLKAEHPEVFVLQEQFDDQASGQIDFVNTMHGEYILYRPYYYDFEGRVMRLRLTIGKPDNPFFASLEHRYDASEFYHGVKEYTFEGVAVPLPDRKRAVVNVLSTEQPDSFGAQLLYVDQMSGYKSRTQTMTGVALGTIGESPATAWPFYARRLKEGEVFEPNVISRSDPEITAAIEEKLALGAVKWKGIY